MRCEERSFRWIVIGWTYSLLVVGIGVILWGRSMISVLFITVSPVLFASVLGQRDRSITALSILFSHSIMILFVVFFPRILPLVIDRFIDLPIPIPRGDVITISSLLSITVLSFLSLIVSMTLGEIFNGIYALFRSIGDRFIQSIDRVLH